MAKPSEKPQQAATASLKIAVTLDAELEIMCEDRRVGKGLLVEILLRYGLKHSKEAVDAWNAEGSERVAWRQRATPPTQLRVARPDEPEIEKTGGPTPGPAST